MWRPMIVFCLLTLLAVLGWYQWNQQTLLALNGDADAQQVEQNDGTAG